MAIRESLLDALSSIATSDFVRSVTAAGASSKVTVSNLAKTIVENYTGSTLAGSSQSVKSAIDALDTSVDALDSTVDAISDYVVEQGTSGIWTYRKWNSGIAECWGTISAGSTAMTTAEGYGYYSSLTTYDYPSSFFVSAPTVSTAANMNGALGNFAFNYFGSTGFNGYWWSTVSTTKSPALGVHAIGRWK